MVLNLTQAGRPYEWHINNGDGLIKWQRGTGDNVELTYLRTADDHRGVHRTGQGRRLLRAMLRALRHRPPYATVYGFTRTCNTRAQEFYGAMGFTLSPVAGVYADGSAVVFSAHYEDLTELHLKEPDADDADDPRPNEPTPSGGQ